MKNTRPDQQRVAIVTGASSGIGEATAERLARAGWRVFGTSRRGAKAAGRGFELLALDVNDGASVQACVDEVLRREGRVDLLVNNAGFGVAPAAAEESSIAQAKAIFDTNFFGLVRMSLAVIPAMRRQRGGQIINIGSILGLLPMPYAALYSASKHAVEGYSEALDHELRTEGIRVSVIEPAYTKTKFDTNNLEADAKVEHYADVRAHVLGVVAEALAHGDEASVVADVVLKVADTAKPKARYPAGALATRLRLLRRFAPAELLDAGVRKDLRLHTLPHPPVSTSHRSHP